MLGLNYINAAIERGNFMNKGLKYIGLTVLTIILIFVFQAIRIGFMFFDFKESMKVINGSSSSGPARKADPPDLLVGLTVPGGMLINGEYVSDLKSDNFPQKLVEDDKIADQLKTLSSDQFDKFRNEILKRVFKQVKDLPEPPEIKFPLEMEAPTQNFREIRETSRYWYFMGRHFMANGDYEAGLASFCAISMLAHISETYPKIGSSLITRMISIAIRNISNTGILETVTRIQLPAKRLLQWEKVFLNLEKSIPGLERSFLSEKQVIPSIFHSSNIRSNGILARKMRDESLHKKYLDPYYDPLIAACKMPFDKATEISHKKGNEIERMSQDIFSPASIQYFFWPEEFIMQLLMTISVPNFRKVFNQDFRHRNIFRGVVVMLGIQAYRNEFNKFPESLEALEKWQNFELPKDIYSNKPFIFNPDAGKILFSVGEDGKPDTDDDMVFTPL
jgi:hypothetical protein